VKEFAALVAVLVLVVAAFLTGMGYGVKYGLNQVPTRVEYPVGMVNVTEAYSEETGQRIWKITSKWKLKKTRLGGIIIAEKVE
jgi:hypothetical protein